MKSRNADSTESERKLAPETERDDQHGRTVGEAASDAARSAAETARRTVAAGKLAAGVAARKVGQTGKQATNVGRRLATQGAKKVGKTRKRTAKASRKPALIAITELSEELKRAYLETLVWLTFQDDRHIDHREVSELHLLMVRLRCDATTRQAVRDAIAHPANLDPEKLVGRALELARDEAQLRDVDCETPSEAEATNARLSRAEAEQKAVGLSLLREAIWLRLSTSAEGTWPGRSLRLATPLRDDPGIGKLAELVGLGAKQLAVLERDCRADQKLLEERLDDRQIKKRAKKIAKDLASIAPGMGLPVTAVYLSGSVTGLSAAGMTSGLAALGFGGVLGASAMATGVGVVLVGGVAVFQGSRWLLNRGARGRSELRKAMLQDILQNHQRALANLAEDIGIQAEKLVRLTEDVEVNQRRLARHAREITLFRSAIGGLRARESQLEAELQREREKPPPDAPSEQAAESSTEAADRPAGDDRNGGSED